ncbi:MAG: radical SAM protein [archaeon]
MTDIGIGNKCNNSCVMCTSIMPPSPKLIEPTTSKILEEINKNKKSDSFTITGGEPTLREDLFEILNYINANSPAAKIKLITNGRRLCYIGYTEKLKKIKNLKVVTELHADKAMLHDYITQTNGSFEQAFIGIQNALATELDVEFRIVISKLNYNNIPSIARLVNAEFAEVNRVVIFPIDLIGNAHKNKEKVAVKYSEITPFVEEALDIIKPKTELYHIPYCVIDKKYHKYIKKGITVLERRVMLSGVCEGCRYEQQCPRVWKTYLKEFGTGEFRK